MTSVTAANGNRPRPAANPLISRSVPGQGRYRINNSVTNPALARGSGHSHQTSARGKWLFLLGRCPGAEILNCTEPLRGSERTTTRQVASAHQFDLTRTPALVEERFER